MVIVRSGVLPGTGSMHDRLLQSIEDARDAAT